MIALLLCEEIRIESKNSSIIQKLTDKSGKEINNKEIWSAFENEYLNANKPFKFT